MGWLPLAPRASPPFTPRPSKLGEEERMGCWTYWPYPLRLKSPPASPPRTQSAFLFFPSLSSALNKKSRCSKTLELEAAAGVENE